MSGFGLFATHSAFEAFVWLSQKGCAMRTKLHWYAFWAMVGRLEAPQQLLAFAEAALGIVYP